MEFPNQLNSSAAPRRFRWGRLFGISALILVVLLLGLRLWASALITRTVNSQLPKFLSAKANLGAVQLSLLGGRVTLRDLVIEQPEGFKGEPLLRLPLATVQVEVSSLNKPVIEVDEIRVENLSAYLIQRKDGTNALLNAVAMLIPQPAQPAKPVDSKAPPTPRVHIRSLRVEKLRLRFDDSSLSEETLSLALTNLNLRVDGLTLDMAGIGGDTAPALATLGLELVQKDRPNAFLHASAKIGVLSTNVPNVNAVMRMTGFSLRNAGPFLKPGVDVALGGDALDLKLDAAVGGSKLNVLMQLVMSNGQVWPIKIFGDLSAPSVDKGALAGALLNRPMKSVQNLAGNLDGAVTAAAGGVGKAIGSGLDGAFKTVGAVGGGLFSSAGKVLRGDSKGAAEALGKTVTDGASAAVDTVASTGGSLVEGVNKAGSSALGTTRSDEWWKGIPVRAEAAQKDASAALQTMPFPLDTP